MGCDIHLYRERKINGVWTSLDKWTEVDDYEGGTRPNVEYDDLAYTGRSYDLFGALCKGVRREFDFSFAERGIPNELSPNLGALIEDYGSDGHSHSYLYLHELRDFANYLDRHTMPVSGMMERSQKAKIQNALDEGREVDWDWLYPYCQGTNAKDHEDFHFDVPASFGIGESLAKIIASFDGVDGSPHELRIVFFFDN